MERKRRGWLVGLSLGATIICAWCSLISGLGGWYAGQDMAQRAAQADFGTAVSQNTLPPLGVLVVRLERDGPADRAGVQRGDLIVAVDGDHVEGASDLHASIEDYTSGDVVRLSVLRDQEPLDVTVQLTTSPTTAPNPYLGVYYTARVEPPADI
ncbi:MAG: Serine protease precursor MucD/AlgY associated with sigma factor RpoE [Chloroflexi bacterium AL-W]|nr:Serine protease precursor MucD/AlgY associated with sigma factor RpoE [Chloroflexi bacterium AL-N1]NOK67767.1 Serine protease precursor MucD/AlgY associated with sigma factor RpoE [Chloroflexi bacterium AL-N10]NOK75463.1 Serine protease precursor MucD/AlgY associated with sigma factor RpoE [Chloroflexi bacterium AL-N5]NOK82251.1 Serine protease precursor MucD/AlgY associated with sigma factor RpoE [Chloroflexi bacterium AL-W]NOK90096.1 Serine protease precursor MucD/AlgY associated with sigm